MLNWLKPFSIFCYLDNQKYTIAPYGSECLVAAGVRHFVEGDDVREIDKLLDQKEWVFGHLSYELKSALHKISSSKKDAIGFAPFYFFVPQIVVEINADTVTVFADEPAIVFNEIESIEATDIGPAAPVEIQAVLSREEYIAMVKSLQEHIHRGDCYEINFCQEFFASEATIGPFSVFQNLLTVSPNPFSAFYKVHDKFLLCASPERFLKKTGNKLLSQPIKGTARRDLVSTSNDQLLKNELRNHPKEQSENVMIVDLVRNDLTRICKEASVKVEELFGIYSFPQVHQMISTISGEIEKGINFSQILHATFPMGSMTGAPKHRVMQLIDKYEPSARGIFSGSVGYFTPSGDFDFNVVIRSIMYHESKKYLSYQVGSAITFYSDAEKEWEECNLKAEAIRRVLS